MMTQLFSLDRRIKFGEYISQSRKSKNETISERLLLFKYF